MLVTLSGVTGTGKSFFKKQISKELNVKNFVIVTTRAKRYDEIDGEDKKFITDKEFEQLKSQGRFAVDFEFLGSKYAYQKEELQEKYNLVTEVHYSTIFDIKKNIKDVFSIYILPYDIERAIKELKERNLPKETQEARIEEIYEHVKRYNQDETLRSQFDYVFVNNYTEKSKNDLLEIVKKKLYGGSHEKESNCRKLENEYASK